MDHNTDSLAKVLQEIFEEWKIDYKVYGATTNNGKNIVNGCVGHLKLRSAHALYWTHTLNKAMEITSVKRALG